jgi:methionyl-tRNA formyltransferase
VLETPRLGCINIHASLLPRWRGAAPIQRAILAGDAQTGITIMQMDAGLDTGDMLLRESLPIGDDTTARLHDRLAALGGKLIIDALHQAESGTLHAERQPAEGVTYAHKVEKSEAQVDWTQDAASIVRRIRDLDPFPGASSALDGETVKLWAAELRTAQRMFGQENRLTAVAIRLHDPALLGKANAFLSARDVRSGFPACLARQ